MSKDKPKVRCTNCKRLWSWDAFLQLAPAANGSQSIEPGAFVLHYRQCVCDGTMTAAAWPDRPTRPLGHGATRKRRIEIQQGPARAWTTGGTTFQLAGWSRTYTVHEQWCMHCLEWIECGSILDGSAFEWLAHHKNGECWEEGTET